MEFRGESEKHFRVVRFMDQFPLGRVRQVLANNLSWDEAELLAQDSLVDVPTEEIVIEDQGDVGQEFDVKPMPDSDTNCPN